MQSRRVIERGKCVGNLDAGSSSQINSQIWYPPRRKLIEDRRIPQCPAHYPFPTTSRRLATGPTEGNSGGWRAGELASWRSCLRATEVKYSKLYCTVAFECRADLSFWPILHSFLHVTHGDRGSRSRGSPTRIRGWIPPTSAERGRILQTTTGPQQASATGAQSFWIDCLMMSIAFPTNDRRRSRSPDGNRIRHFKLLSCLYYCLAYLFSPGFFNCDLPPRHLLPAIVREERDLRKFNENHCYLDGLT